MNIFEIHDRLNQKAFVNLAEAENICESYAGHSWIKDKNCIFQKAKKKPFSLFKTLIA